MRPVAEPELSSRLHPGTRVEVHSRFEDRWSNGFEVAEATETGYRVRRLSDGAVLPGEFADDDVRRERKRETWWF
jgi:hypothetical protein